MSALFFVPFHPCYNISLAIQAQASASAKSLFISLINQINHHLYHHILFLCLAFCNHQSQGYKGVVSQAFGAIFAIEDMIIVAVNDAGKKVDKDKESKLSKYGNNISGLM